MKKSRRKFIKDSACIAGGSLLLSQNTMASMKSNKKTSQNGTAKDLFICIFQRGGADGLHSVVPHAESQYFALRPQTAVFDSIDLDGFFGLNQNLSALKPIWDAGDLGIVHAFGSVSDSRSHFDSQDSMEFASFNKNFARKGWLAKYLSNNVNQNDSVFRVVSLNAAVQKSIKGTVEALTISNIQGFDVNTHGVIYQDTIQTMDEMYRNGIQFESKSRVMFSAIDELKTIDVSDYPVNNGAVYPSNGFANKLKTLGVLIKADLGLEVACLDIGGWDHHNELVDSFPMPAQAMSQGILAFYQDMGERMENITILCMTEFGRRAKENASKGTDHGHASVLYAIGGGVNGGTVHANWPGLSETDLYRGDLAVTTDFREVFSELLVKRLDFNQDLETIIPDYNYLGGIGLFKQK